MYPTFVVPLNTHCPSRCTTILTLNLIFPIVHIAISILKMNLVIILLF